MPVVSRGAADRIARDWLDAFNAHRPDLVVARFAADVTVRTPVLERLRPGSGGELTGRDAVLEYYREGLRLVPELRFSLVDVLTGVDQVTILYRDQRGTLVAEALTLCPDGDVGRVDVAYAASASR